MPLVAGIDSSTQSCKVVILDAQSGAQVRFGAAAHPDGAEIDPQEWERALQAAIEAAGGLDDVAAVAVAAQQHGMVALDEQGQVVRPALLWNDTRSAGAAADLVAELGGAQAWADAVGSVPLAAFTVTKLRWMATHEPANAGRTAAVCLPHDWLTWRLSNADGLDALTTDRSDASGTGYWSSTTGIPAGPRRAGARSCAHHADRARSHPVGRARLKVVLSSDQVPATTPGPRSALDIRPGDVIVSLGTSGVACAVSDQTFSDRHRGRGRFRRRDRSANCRWCAR